MSGPPESPPQASLLCSAPAHISDAASLNPLPNESHFVAGTTGTCNVIDYDMLK